MKEDDSEAKTPIQIDVYGLKAKVQPQPEADSDPESFRELGRRFLKDLLATLAGLSRLLPTTVKAAISLMRGLGDLGQVPRAIQKRIESAHDLAEEREAERAALPAGPEARAVAEATIRRILGKKAAEGLSVGSKAEDGRLIIIIVPPVDDDQLAALAGHALNEARLIEGTTMPRPRLRLEVLIEDQSDTLERLMSSVARLSGVDTFVAEPRSVNEKVAVAMVVEANSLELMDRAVETIKSTAGVLAVASPTLLGSAAAARADATP